MANAFSKTSPIYLQIVDMLKVDIAAGRYGPDDRLPAVRDLALQCGVNPNTVQRAYQELENQGLVQSERTAGRFLTIDEQKIAQLKDSLCAAYISDLFAKMTSIGLDEEEAVKKITEWRCHQ